MTRKFMILSVTCLSLAACAEGNGDALSMGGYSGSSGGVYAQGYTGTGAGGSAGTLPAYGSTSVADSQLDRHSQ